MRTKLQRVLKTIALCVPVVLLMNCSGSDDNENTNNNNSNDKIIGEWKYAGYYDAEEDQFYENDFGPCYVEIADFNSNGTGTWTEDDCGDVFETDFEWENEGSNAYSLSGDGESSIIQVDFRNQDNRLYVFDDEDGSADVYDRQ